MDDKPTHKIVYLTKEGIVRVVYPTTEQEATVVLTILRTNDVLYTIEDLRPMPRSGVFTTSWSPDETAQV